jgi:hypothetical protein
MVTTPRERWSSLRASLSLPALVLALMLLSALRTQSPLAAAQKQIKPNEPYALIFGTVWGPGDRPVYGVKVLIRRTDKKTTWELYSDHRGEFAQRIAAGKGDYVVWADPKNFKSPDGTPLRLVQDVPVHVENDERVDVSLHLTK